jgi:hypothetical protein
MEPDDEIAHEARHGAFRRARASPLDSYLSGKKHDVRASEPAEVHTPIRLDGPLTHP